jgi:hypothetical protein
LLGFFRQSNKDVIPRWERRFGGTSVWADRRR